MSALSHITVVELAEGVAGEYCGKLMADFGARVIKVERPGAGSPTRYLGPFGKGQAGENSGLFAFLNTNKRSVSLDLASDDGRAMLDRLLAQADAVIDDHAPGWLAGVGLDADTRGRRWPRLTVCAITPFGQDAPPERRHAEDMTVMHASSWGYHTPTHGDPARPPLKGAGRFLPSYEAGMEAAMCVAAALYGREENGAENRVGGRFIDVSKQAVMVSRIDYVLGQMVAGDMDVGDNRHQFDFTGPQDILPCADGYIYVWMSTPGHWTALGELIGGDTTWMDDFPSDWLERGLTPERVELVREHLTAWLAKTGKDDAAAKAQALGLTLVPVNDPSDLVRSPQFAHRGFFTEIAHPVLGAARYPGVPYQMSVTPARIERAAPLLGQDQAEFAA